METYSKEEVNILNFLQPQITGRSILQNKNCIEALYRFTVSIESIYSDENGFHKRILDRSILL